MKRIAILTSGGDTPGMNAAIQAATLAAKTKGMSVWGVTKGYQGLIEGRIFELHSKDVRRIIKKGGTILKTARCEEMKTPEGQNKAVTVLKAFSIDGLVVIGGDGSFLGAKALSTRGIPTVALPGTIDNDLAYTDYTIGFDTAVNCVVQEMEKIRDTMASHERIGVVEVMGNKCGDIALYSAVASEADFIILPEMPFDVDRICQKLQARSIKGEKTSLIVVSEGSAKGEAVANYIRAKTKFDVKAIVLGYVQRGGSPTAFDRMLAIKTAVRAVELLLEGEQGKVVGLKNNKIIDVDIDKALAATKKFERLLFDHFLAINAY